MLSPVFTRSFALLQIFVRIFSQSASTEGSMQSRRLMPIVMVRTSRFSFSIIALVSATSLILIMSVFRPLSRHLLPPLRRLQLSRHSCAVHQMRCIESKISSFWHLIYTPISSAPSAVSSSAISPNGLSSFCVSTIIIMLK